ncbi:MAG: DJ-1/PfpI family protein [Deltaproteobacteria bacterium]|nr:DJ-1/PfpI family protein [Deltaproteobacteria bacterium]
MKKILITLAPGFEEIEALATADILRRASANVTLASTVSGPVEGRNGIKVLADTTLDEAAKHDYDIIILPGGAKGTENLKADKRVKELITKQAASGKLLAAICAAPTILSAAGLLKGRKVTSHPSVRKSLDAAKVTDDRVVIDSNIITSQGPGTTLEFAFALVEILYGKEKATEVNSGVLARL